MAGVTIVLHEINRLLKLFNKLDLIKRNLEALKRIMNFKNEVNESLSVYSSRRRYDSLKIWFKVAESLLFTIDTKR